MPGSSSGPFYRTPEDPVLSQHPDGLSLSLGKSSNG